MRTKSNKTTVNGTSKGLESSNHSSDKIFQIIECLAENRLPMKLQEISQKLSMSQSTALRYLNSMIRNNYVYQEESTSRYGLTMKVCRLNEKINTSMSMRNIASPFMNKLATKLNLGVCFVVRNKFQALYLDVVDNTSMPFQMLIRIGKNAPLSATSSGKIILSSLTEWELNEYLDTHPLEKLTEYTIVDRERLLEELALVRRRGYATDFEECELGIRCAGVPVFNYTDKFAACLTCFGTPDKISEERFKQEILPEINLAAREISTLMGSNVMPEYVLL